MPPSDSSRDAVLERLAEEFIERHRRGECPSLTDYTDRHPDLAADIRDLFPTLLQIEHLKPATGDLTGPSAARIPGARHPECLGEYRILREIGHGGMGVVYEAEQVSLGRRVALKVLPPQLLLNGTYLDRFNRESRAAARLHHTNIVPVFGVGQADGVPFYAMQYIRGEGLDKVLADLRRLRPGKVVPELDGSVAHSLLTGQFAAPTPTDATAASLPRAPDASPSSTLSGRPASSEYHRSVARIGVQVAEALSHAHKQGILHRDIKPSNLLLDGQGTVWVTDFGLAKAEGTDGPTQAGDIVGTIRYMAPERFDDRSLPQSDVYALGLTLYELLTLQPAFDDPNRGRLIQKVLHDPPTTPRKLDPSIPRDLETIVLKCAAKDPAERYATAAALAEDLRRFLADRPILARRSSTAERLWRWCRRNPWIAGLSGALLLLLTVTSVGGVALSISRGRALEAATAAEREGKRKLLAAYIAEADAKRLSGVAGQRFGSLDAIRKALQLLPELELTEPEQEKERSRLRNLAISSLTRMDIRVVKEWDDWPKDRAPILDRVGLQTYASGDPKGNLTVRRMTDDTELGRLDGTGKPRWSSFGPDDRTLYLMDQGEGILKRWTVGDLEPIQLMAVEWGTGRFELSRDARRCMQMVPVPGGFRVNVYDLAGGARRFSQVFRGDRENPWKDQWAAALSPDGRRLAVIEGAYGDPARQTVLVMDVDTGRVMQKLLHEDLAIGPAWHPDSRTLAVGQWNYGKVYLWDGLTGKPLHTLREQRGGEAIQGMSAAGQLLTSFSGWGHGQMFWHPHTGKPLLRTSFSLNMQQTAQDGRLFALEQNGPRLRLHVAEPSPVLATLVPDPFGEPLTNCRQVDVHRDGRLMAVGHSNGVSLFDLDTNLEVARVPLQAALLVRFDPASGDLLTGGPDGLLRWPLGRAADSTFTFGPPRRLLGTTRMFDGFDVSRDGRTVVAAAGTRALLLDGYGSGPIRSFGPLRDCRDVQVSPDGQWVITHGHGNGENKVWDTRTGHAVAEGAGLYGQFTPDGKWYTTGYRQWEVGPWTEGPGPVTDGPGVRALAPDGKSFIGWEVAGQIHLRDTATGRTLAVLELPEPVRLMYFAYSPDGTKLVCSSADEFVAYVWDLRAIRKHLTELKLDWEAPAFSPTVTAEQPLPSPLQVRLHLGDLEDDAVLLANSTPEHLRHLIVANSLAVTFQPLNIKAYRQRGRAYGALNEPRAAIADYSVALALMAANDPTRPDLLGRRAANYLALAEDDRAAADLRQVAQLDASRAAQFRSTHASSLMRQALLASGRNEPAAALRLLRRAVQIDPDHATAHNNLAWQLLTGPKEQAHAEEALKHARRAVELTRGQPTHLNTLGVALYRSGQFAKAVPVLEESLAASRGQWDGYDLFCLAMCHARLGDTARAKECFDRAVKWREAQKDLTAPEVEELKAFRAEAESAVNGKLAAPPSGGP